jgi:hypothetical protein
MQALRSDVDLLRKHFEDYGRHQEQQFQQFQQQYQEQEALRNPPTMFKAAVQEEGVGSGRVD